MNSSDINELIVRIAATPSKLEKQALIAKHAGSAEFKRVLVAALDPLTTYGIEAIPEYKPGSGLVFDEGTWGFLDRLARRDATGNSALEELRVRLEGMWPGSAKLLVKIITKDLRAGFSESTANKAIPGLVREFPYMRCCLPKDTDLTKFDWATGVFSQEKADGMFANLNRGLGDVATLHSRQGSPFPMAHFQVIVAEAVAVLPADTQTHGELLVIKAGKTQPREISNGILNSVLQGGAFEADEEPIYFAWDQIPLDAVVPKGKYMVPYAERWGRLDARVGTGFRIRSITTRIVHSLPEAYAHYRELLALGKEGVVIKHPHAIWKDGDSKEQVKLKLDADCDLKIVGFAAGKGKNEATFGSITCRTADDLLEVGVSGFKDAVRKDIHARRDALLGTVVTVKANGIMSPANDGDLHSLFLPRFVELRVDKHQADTLQRVRDQFDAAVKCA